MRMVVMEASVAQTKANMFRRGGAAGAGSTAAEGSSGAAAPPMVLLGGAHDLVCWLVAGEEEGQLITPRIVAYSTVSH